MQSIHAHVKRTWTRTTPFHPCPSCQRSGWCQTADGLVMCCRVQQPGAVARTDRAGTPYYLWSPDGRPASRRVQLSRPATNPTRAGPQTLDLVYGGLLSRLTLSAAHREALRRRGLSDDAIDRGRYRSVPGRERVRVVRELAEVYGQLLLSAPGMYLRQGANGRAWPSVAGRGPGVLIPVRDIDGRIIALMVRADDPPDGVRYRYLSSAHRGGPGPGSPCHVPVGTAAAPSVIRIAEGALKADVASALSGVPTVGVPGVGAWRTCLPLLCRLRPARVIVAWDREWLRHGHHVRRSLVQLLKVLTRCGITAGVETWDWSRAKGIDDALAAGLTTQVRWIGGAA